MFYKSSIIGAFSAIAPLEFVFKIRAFFQNLK